MKKCLDCGKEKSDKGLYCKRCGYNHRTRPSGLKYVIKQVNSGWIQKGQKLFSGRKHNEETRAGWSRRRKGKHPSVQTEFKIGDPRIVGARNPNWKGGITPENKAARATLEYKLWRKAVFERDDYTCRDCGVRGGMLHADHIKPFALFPELRTSVDNGRTLCVACHRKTDTFGYKLLHI